MTGRSIIDKVWERNEVRSGVDGMPSILHIGLHLVHEVTSPQAFAVLDERGIKVRRPDLTLATVDHSTPTRRDADGTLAYTDEKPKAQVATLRKNAAAHGLTLLDEDHPDRGIVHMVGPEQGMTKPGIVIVCGDSHTATHGAFGALAFGIGTTEVGHVLATQTLFQNRPRTMRVQFDGALSEGVSAKDMALAFIAAVGSDGGTHHVIEYTGDAVRALDMEGRMTLCNMTIEAGARAGLIAPDQATIDYLKAQPGGATITDAVQDEWLALRSDPDATFDRHVTIDASTIVPMVTWGTSPDMATAANGMVPRATRSSETDAASYMGVTAGQEMQDIAVHRVFIGSCTNGRLSDLEAAAAVLKGQRIKDGVTTLVVPGSERVKRDAEAIGLDRIFEDAGAVWREPGCSMCIAMNGDRGEPGEVVVSTSNRNFKGRQGEGVRTILASPATAAASAVAGHVATADTIAKEGATA